LANSRTSAVGWKIISLPPLSLIHKKPAVPEFDFSGVIVGGKLDGTGYMIGQEVFGIAPTEEV
jgi:NADPH:quinone reductase-like Zn-dependent oxidoreductase